jgi:peptidylprolyl isomerase
LSTANRTLSLFVLVIALFAIVGCENKQKPLPPAATAPAVIKPAETAVLKLPLGVPAPGVSAVTTPKDTLFTLSYQEIEIGKGPVAEPNKLYKVHYIGWLGANGRADDGRKFDSSYDHPGPPMKDKENKLVMGDDGKPKMGPPQPLPFPQGMGRLIPGFDQGVSGMRIGGKRRIFIPWQLAYGAMGRPGPDADHPGIPPKADLIFDVTLVEVTDLPMPPNHPPMGGMRPMPGGPGTSPQNVKLPTLGTAPKPPAPATPASAATPTATPASSAAPAAAPKPAAPAAPATTPAQPATTPVPPPPQPK